MITFAAQSVQPRPRLQVLFGYAKPPRPQDRFHPPSGTDTFIYAGPPKETTTVESLLGAGQIFNKIDGMLNRADFSILGDLYSWESPELYPDKSSPAGTPGKEIQGQLLNKVINTQNGKWATGQPFKVSIILDNSKERSNRTPVEGINLLKAPVPAERHNDRTINKLRQNRVDVAVYPEKLSRINHVKAFIVDDDEAVVGGMNWGNHSPANHDAAVYIKGPDVRNIINDIFKPDWRTCGRQLSELPPPIQHLQPFLDGKIEVLQTRARQPFPTKYPFGPYVHAKDEIFWTILDQLAQTKNSFCAELFVLTQSDVIDEMIKTHRRLKANGKVGGHVLVDPGLYYAFPNCRPGIQRLKAAGVPIKFFAANRDTDEKLHAKWAVFDDQRLLIGSANWSNLGLLSNGELDEPRISKSNHEMALLIPSRKIASKFTTQFVNDWNKSSKLIPPPRPAAPKPAVPQPVSSEPAALFELPGVGTAPVQPNAVASRGANGYPRPAFGAKNFFIAK